MRYSRIKRLLAIGLTIAGLAFSGHGFAAGCFDPGENDTFVTQYGGADLNCPSGAYTECAVNFKNGAITGMTAGCTDLALEVNIDSMTGGVTWQSNAASANDYIDAILTDSAQGGKGCLYSFGADKSSGAVGYATSETDFFPPTQAVFCSDRVAEVTAAPPPPPATVQQCVINGGDSKIIHGVTFNCPSVPAGETRTIVVAKETKNCFPNGEFDDELNPIYECDPEPRFGFTDENGNIDFNNVCQCVGPAVVNGQPVPTTPVLKEECDPDPENTEGGCEVINAENPVVITFQNPRCFWVGGFARCF